MYAALLSNRYLTSRLIPLIAVGAVALCVALVVVVVSVMTGFLETLRASGRTMVGDVIISSGVGGIPYYEELVVEIDALPESEAATALVETMGLIKMPYPRGGPKEVGTVQVWGIDPSTFHRVTEFDKSLYWKPPQESARATLGKGDPRRDLDDTLLRDGLALRQSATGRSGIALGIHVSAANQRQSDGSYLPIYGWFMPRESVTLTLVPVSGSGKISEPTERKFPVVNEVFSGVFQVDNTRVYIPLSEAQSMLRMDEAPLYDTHAEPGPDGSLPLIGTTPARANKIIVRTADGYTPDQLRSAVEHAYNLFKRRISQDSARVAVAPDAPSILTWEQQLRDLIAPVEKEREMMRILFSIIYLVCAGLILSIFWAIVIEKTTDIGVLRSVGASRAGILWLFLRYALVIGIVGSLCGVGLAWMVIHNINAIHEAIGRDAPMLAWALAFGGALACAVATAIKCKMGKLLPTLLWGLAALVLTVIGVGLLLHRGTLIWDPAVYYFPKVPDQVDWPTAWITCAGGIIFSVLGALVPAAKAADTDPVEALRYG